MVRAACEQRPCKVPGCEDAYSARGYCAKHYFRWYRTGDSSLKIARLTLRAPEAIKQFIKDNTLIDSNGCWIWQRGASGGMPYGAINVDGKQFKAHRVSGAIHNGWDLFSPLMYCHHCDVSLCTNPAHLFLGTAADNAQDRAVKGRGAIAEKNYNTKLTRDQVTLIRTLRAQGSSYSIIAMQVGTSKRTVLDVLQKRTWKHFGSGSPFVPPSA